MSEDIMLISTNYKIGRRAITPPLGIMSIASKLEKDGYDGRITIIDGCYLSKKYGYRSSIYRIRKEIKEKKPFIVGCTLHYGTVNETARICIDGLVVGSHVIVGGHLATATHESLAKELYKLGKICDSSSTTAVVRGEGEITARELIGALYEGRNLHGINGVTFYDGKEIVVNPDRELVDLNTLEPPAYHLVPSISEYNDEVALEESRGCLFECSFCSIRRYYPDHRLKSPERIRIEVGRTKKLGARRIGFIGELILLHKERALKIADVMEEFGYEWDFSAHPKLILKQKDILPTLRKKGLISIETGIESANQNSLDLFNKGTTPKIGEKVIKILEKAGIPPSIDFIPFQPYMGMDDLYENIMFMTKHLPFFSSQSRYPVNLSHSWIPNPNTPLYEKALSDKLLIRKNGRVRVKYRDRKVYRVMKNFDYFLNRHLKDYHRRRDEIIRICDEEHKGEPIYRDERLTTLGKLPVLALIISWKCVENNIPAKKHIDSVVKQSFEAVDNGIFDRTPKIIENIRNEIENKLQTIRTDVVKAK